MLFQKASGLINRVTSTRASGIYLLLFAIAIAVATFIENDFGTSAAQKVVFKSLWFELLLLVFSLAILANIIRFRLVKQKKWASLSFHLAIVLILVGAAVTRYFGTEGMMHIREGETSNTYLSSESYLKFQLLKDGKTYSFDEPANFASLGDNSFQNEYQIGNNLLKVKLNQFIPNPVESALPDPSGVPMVKVVIAGASGREEYFVKQGDRVNINGINFNFSNSTLPGAYNIFLQNDSLFFSADRTVQQTVMATQEHSELAAGGYYPLRLRSLYVIGNSSFVFGEFIPRGTVSITSGERKIKNESALGLDLQVSMDGNSQSVMVTGGKGEEGRARVLDFDNNIKLAISYGSKGVKLPFSIRCNDFILETYPGTQNPSSYASEVTLFDQEKSINRDQRIFMNNILDYRGYRFFQSSFDQDELGTYLSVNHDRWGTNISYLGYALLTIGLLMTFFDKKSRFSFLLKRLNEMQNKTTVLVAILLLSLSLAKHAKAQPGSSISSDHAALFGKTLVVQDHNGRVKPLNTFNNEILRKISRKESYEGLSSDQVILSMMLNPAEWQNVPIIQIPNSPELQDILHTTSRNLSYASFFNSDGSYKLQEHIRKAQSTIPKDQGTLDKAIIKLDEKVNIVNMVFSGSLFRLFPQPGDQTNSWQSPAEVLHSHGTTPVDSEAKNLFLKYLQAVSDGTGSHNFQAANLSLNQLAAYQKTYGSAIIPSQAKIKSEIFLNKLNAFNRLRNYYGILCLVFTVMFFYVTIKKRDKRVKWTKYAFWAMALGFTFHTLGLGLRWYISGRAPWSNGYESMIYIGWTTVLGGTLFSRRSLGGLAATATLAATILMVASLSWLDPEITPLVPVLKSYWLTIHVSLEAGSYGFLLLGAVIGMLNLLLIIFMNEKNKENISRAVKELTIISEITLLSGLAMISIGTYLGGVWANESWGRYWGWDAKETWALVTILVYAFILHMRFIPKLKGIFAFNFASLFGFATVIMTYLGVNYYLSGLHSYAAGDPVPIPPSVYYTTTALALLSVVSFIKYKKNMAPAK